MASETDMDVVRVRPKTPEMLKRELWRCDGLCEVDAVAVSTVVVAVGSEGGWGAWNETRCPRLRTSWPPSLGDVIDPAIDGVPEGPPEVDGAVRLDGKWTVGAGDGEGDGAMTVGIAGGGVRVVDGESRSAQSVAAAMRDARPCIE